MTVVSCVLLLAGVASAGTLEVRVLDPAGEAVPEVAVFVNQLGVNAAADREREPAVMDQRDSRFVPHVLVVEKGAGVEFPNSDIIAHHVYSFSKPNDFVLPLYKGSPPDPVRFEHDGIVTLGCNIHDHMLAYIVVVDTPVFGVTDRNGTVSLQVDDAATGYEVHAWSARIRDSKRPLVQQTATAGEMIFSLEKKLRPRHDDETDSVQWDEY